jgi:hypothetical protein
MKFPALSYRARFAMTPPPRLHSRTPDVFNVEPAALDTPIETREKLQRLQDAMFDAAKIYGAADCPTLHYFAHGVYGREMQIPKDVCAIGKIHKFSQITVVLKGEMLMRDEGGVRTLKAGDRFVTPAGVKRAVYAKEDSSLITFHGTEKTDVAEIEKELIAPDWETLDRFLDEQKRIGATP